MLDGEHVDRYRLLQRIGRGGMGEVYLAEDPRLGQKVAIKLVRNELASPAARAEEARLFEREVKAIARLDHPNILPLYDYGEHTIDGTTFSYLVMPYRQEGSLGGIARRLAASAPGDFTTRAASYCPSDRAGRPSLAARPRPADHPPGCQTFQLSDPPYEGAAQPA